MLTKILDINQTDSSRLNDFFKGLIDIHIIKHVCTNNDN